MILNSEHFSNSLYSAMIQLLQVGGYVLLAFNIILLISSIALGTWNEPQFYQDWFFYVVFFGFYKKLFTYLKQPIIPR